MHKRNENSMTISIFYLQDEENKLYELVVRHFLACVSKDAQGDETIIKIEISNEKVRLNS